MIKAAGSFTDEFKSGARSTPPWTEPVPDSPGSISDVVARTDTILARFEAEP